MTDRMVSDAALAPSSRLVGQPLASPVRRVCGFILDCALLIVPSLLVAVGSSAISLFITDRVAFQAIKTELVNRPQDHAVLVTTLGRMAPLLVRSEAAGLPPSVVIAVHEGDFDRAGEILSGYTLEYAIGGEDKEAPQQDPS